jgi:hypothetical protein
MSTLLEARCISKEDETDSEDGDRWVKVLRRCNRVAFKVFDLGFSHAEK